MVNRDQYTQVAESVPFDNDNNAFASDNVQEAIEEIGASASPGYSFGRNGALSQNTWLRRPGNVPSNRAGVTVDINNPTITKVACANRNVETYDVELYEHEGNEVNLTLLGSVTVTAATSGIFNVSFSVTQGRQLAVRLGSTSTGNVRDLGVDVTLVGNS
jgi:hypothetical protein